LVSKMVRSLFTASRETLLVTVSDETLLVTVSDETLLMMGCAIWSERISRANTSCEA
jgi:hypothetical protein